MNDDTVKLVRIPADTWRVVVEALEESEPAVAAVERQKLSTYPEMHPVVIEGATGRVNAALELARKVSAE